MAGEPETKSPTAGISAGTYITRSPEETFALGRLIGQEVAAQTVFLLRGDLGSGKTLFTKGLAAGLDIDPTDVTSPSFTLINEHIGRLRLFHVDLYRLGSVALPDLGLQEILEGADAVVAIEWAERLDWKPEGAFEIELEWVSSNERSIRILSPSDLNGTPIGSSQEP